MSLPSGYERLLLHHAVAVAQTDIAASIRSALVNGDGSPSTLHEFAARHPGGRVLRGRDAAYAVTLPRTAMRVVVRHNRHGGLFRAITRDLFLSPTRAPYELEASLQLTRLGIPTPEVVAYALYPPGSVLQRADVCSREIPGSRDLASVLTGENPSERSKALRAAAGLLVALSRVGARHHDLNAKNILLTRESAYVLDVDRVTFNGDAKTTLDANLARLTRSLRKWRDRFGARISEADVAELETACRDRAI